MSSSTKRQIVLRAKRTFSRSATAGPSMTEASLPTLTDVALEQADLTPAEAADARRDPEVAAIAESMPLKLIEPVGDPEPSPTAVSQTWGMEAVGADTSPFDGTGVVVAVLDTGINPNHVAFQGVTLDRKNFTDGGDDDQHGHGTHCAGTIFGRDVNGLRIGVARGVSRALIGKVLGPGGGSSADLASAIFWAYENGANVISMSLGIDFPGFVERLVNEAGFPIIPATSIALEQYRANVNLFNTLPVLLERSASFSQAAIIVAASGNESNRPTFEVAVSPPAAGDGIISVGALQRSAVGNLSVASFSNTQCNLSGPGVSVTSSWIGASDALRTINGTSMATPHVAGCATLWAQKLLQQMGRLTSDNLAAKTLASAQFITGGAFDDIGNGIVRAPQS